MAAPKKGRSQGQPRPGRSLAVILLALAGLVGGMFLSGHTTPRLGIDLAGGTSITLTAKAEPGQESAINQTNMRTAVSIIERRVNGLGVSEAEVQTQGDKNIIVNIPRGTNEKQAQQQVGQTARLFFRPVLAVVPVAPAATPSPSAPPSTSPSGSTSPKPSGSGKTAEKTSPVPSASASSTTAGRAVSEGLRQQAPKPQAPKLQDPKLQDPEAQIPKAQAPTPQNPTPQTPKPQATQPPNPVPTPSPGGQDTSVPADLQKKLDALKCGEGHPKPPLGKPGEPVVACGTGESKDSKYALGPVAVDGTDLDSADSVLNQQQGQWQVNLKFTGTGAKKFADITGKLAGQTPPKNQFAIVLDGDVVSHPQVNEAIGGGQAEITGQFTQQQTADLANILSFGALPLSFDTSDVTTVSAALGGDQLKGGLIAGAVGLALVILYSLLYYRGLAFVSIVSLLVSAALTYTIMTLLGPSIGFALNLPAVCGAIVAIGITADSFIVYFERIRDEIREGRSLRPAVERAWPRARRTILVSDFVSFLAAAVLFIVSVGKVQGFAFTLGLTTLLDVVVVFLFTKPLMTLLARRRFFANGHRMSGLDPRRLGAKPPIRGGRRRPATPVKEA